MSKCFNRQNNEAVNLYPCDPDGTLDLKTCCAPNDRCAANGLCVAPPGADVLTRFFVNGCTVDGWNDPSCPNQCLRSSGNGIKECGDGRFCCYGLSGCDCNNATVVFTMSPVRIVATIPADIASTTRSSSASTTSTVTSSTGTGTNAPITSQTSAPGDSGSGGGLAIGLGVGLGVGVPLTLLVLGGLWLFNRRQKRKAAAAPNNWEGYQAPAEQQWPTPGMYYDQTKPEQQPTINHELPSHPTPPQELSSEYHHQQPR